MNARDCRNYIPQLLPEVSLVVHSIGVIALLLKSKVEKILKGSLDLIPSPSVKIQIMGGKVCLRCKGKTLLGVVNKLGLKKFVDNTQKCFTLTPQTNFPAHNLNFHCR